MSSGPPSKPSVVVVGGGLAGITAALDCAAAGAAVTLCESRGRLGGRAYSFGRDGLRADNGQHVFLRCCTAYRAFVERIGAGAMVTLQSRLDIPLVAPDGRRARLRRTGLPAPLHLAGAVLRYPFLSLPDRLSVAWAMRALAAVDVDDPGVDALTFGDWLRAHGQRDLSLWDLIVRSTVNLGCDDASLAQCAYVFQEGLLSSASAGDLGHAVVPLSEIHDVAARETLERAGVEVRLRAGVAAIAPGYRVSLRSGDALHADAVVLAVDAAHSAELLPAGSGVDVDGLAALGESPIVNVHVIYDRPVLDVPFAAGIDTPVQWVFDRTRSSGLAGAGGGEQYLAVTVSAADEELAMSNEAVLDTYLPALRELLPLARDADVVRAFVTRDHGATFRAAPGQRARRPPGATRLPGLALAGAYTDTGWPATMEGAVRSGHDAARAALSATRAVAPMTTEIAA